jgi:hypothetical protein
MESVNYGRNKLYDTGPRSLHQSGAPEITAVKSFVRLADGQFNAEVLSSMKENLFLSRLKAEQVNESEWANITKLFWP